MRNEDQIDQARNGHIRPEPSSWQLLLNFSIELDVESKKVKGKWYFWVKNVKQVLESRLLRLQESKNLDFGGKFSEKIWYATGDLKILSLLSEGILKIICHLFRYATGDLKILSSLYGHMGSASTHPCLLCEAPKEFFRSSEVYPPRTLYSIEIGYRHYF
uniref:Uncharacterized protein n=1 Tax=Ditylenchus dipsaci TaxID=166011 RepID=A0A915DE54_9BILA